MQVLRSGSDPQVEITKATKLDEIVYRKHREKERRTEDETLGKIHIYFQVKAQ